jgi:nicotinamide riboside kinase
LKIVITGPECSGKTTLAQSISTLLSFELVPEVAREYLQLRNNQYKESDLYEMALLQIWEEKMAQLKTPNICCDTDLLTIIIWQEEKYSHIDPVLMEQWVTSKPELYLLCYPEMAWEDDGQRENPSDRDRLFDVYKHFLTHYDKPFECLKGSHDERLMYASGIIEKMLKMR